MTIAIINSLPPSSLSSFPTSGDLGRLVGSYEKYCFRTLSERYRDEPLLLESVLTNIQ